MKALKTVMFAMGIGGALNSAYGGESSSTFPVLQVTKGDRSVLLVGSNHAAPKKIYDADAAQVMAAARSLCLEVAPDDQEMAKQAMRAVMMNTTGLSFAQRHGPQLSEDISQALAWNSLLASKVDSFSDETLATLLWVLPPSRQEQTPPSMVADYSIDAALLDVAKQRRLPVRSIENADALAHAASRMSHDEWDDYIRKSLNMAQCKECLREFAKHTALQYGPNSDYEYAYREVAVAFVSDKALFGYFDRLTLSARNPGLVRNIDDRALNRSECDVVAIGAAHLGGPDGVVSLLKKLGATVTPLTAAK